MEEDIFDHGRKSKFALRIYEARNSVGLTCNQVADKLGKKSHSTVLAWECDKSLPPLDDFVKLCSLYGVTPNYILGFKE